MKFGAPARPNDHWSAFSRFDLTMSSEDFWSSIGAWVVERLGPAKKGRRQVWTFYSNLGRDFSRISIWPKDVATEFMLKWGDHPALVDGRSNTSGTASNIVIDRYQFWIDTPWAEARTIVQWCIDNLEDYHWDWGGSLYGRWYFWMKTDAARLAFQERWGGEVKVPPIPDPVMDAHLRMQITGASSKIRTISLWQPWASLIIAGKKQHETRSFKAHPHFEGERIGIHAAKKMPKEIAPELHQLCVETFGSDYRKTLPRGALLGTAELVGCHPSEAIRDDLDPADLIAGDWSDERYGWRLADPYTLPSPVPTGGKQGWWRVPASEFHGEITNR